MNKRIFTFLAVSCAAMAVNAQTITYDMNGKVKVPHAYTSAEVGDVDVRRPYTIMGNGNKIAQITDSPVKITKLENVDKGAEAKLFQLRYTDNSNPSAPKDYFLAMQWNNKANIGRCF